MHRFTILMILSGGSGRFAFVCSKHSWRAKIDLSTGTFVYRDVISRLVISLFFIFNFDVLSKRSLEFFRCAAHFVPNSGVIIFDIFWPADVERCRLRKLLGEVALPAYVFLGYCIFWGFSDGN